MRGSVKKVMIAVILLALGTILFIGAFIYSYPIIYRQFFDKYYAVLKTIPRVKDSTYWNVNGRSCWYNCSADIYYKSDVGKEYIISNYIQSLEVNGWKKESLIENIDSTIPNVSIQFSKQDNSKTYNLHVNYSYILLNGETIKGSDSSISLQIE